MAYNLSLWVDDDTILNNIRNYFSADQMFDFDENIILNTIVQGEDDVLYLNFRGMEFIIDKITGDVEVKMV